MKTYTDIRFYDLATVTEVFRSGAGFQLDYDHENKIVSLTFKKSTCYGTETCVVSWDCSMCTRQSMSIPSNEQVTKYHPEFDQLCTFNLDSADMQCIPARAPMDYEQLARDNGLYAEYKRHEGDGTLDSFLDDNDLLDNYHPADNALWRHRISSTVEAFRGELELREWRYDALNDFWSIV